MTFRDQDELGEANRIKQVVGRITADTGILVQAKTIRHREYSSTMVNKYFLSDEGGKGSLKSTSRLPKGCVALISVPDAFGLHRDDMKNCVVRKD